MAKFPNSISTSNLIKRLKPFDKGPKSTWFAINYQPKGSIHRFEIIEIKHTSMVGIPYIVGKCVTSLSEGNIGRILRLDIGRTLRLDRDGAIINRSNISTLLSIDIRVGGKFSIQYLHDTQHAYLIEDSGD